jgi:molecular chaperone DnaK
MSDMSQLAVGIDLGTTHSVLAYRDADGRPVTVRNAEGDLTTPSVVYFHSSEVVVGKEAAKVALHEPDCVAQYAKRDMGRSDFHKSICGHRLPPEVVQSLILKKLKVDARNTLGEVRKAVVTVPAYFNEPRRKATQDAGRLAGLEVLDIINEPTAAAIAFGMQKGFLSEEGQAHDRELVMVYDLGGGTFDATLMELEGRRYRALATAGDVHLGGIDWNRRIVDHLAMLFEEEHGIDMRKDAVGWQVLMAEAEDAKRALTTRSEASVHLSFDGHRSRILFTRQEFESLTEDLLQRTLFTIRRLVRDAKLEWSDLTRLLLVGGSTRMPMISEMLSNETTLELDRSLSPDEAVAHGAAIYADLLQSYDGTQRPEVEVTNVSSHDLGVLGIETETGRPRRQILISRNTALPAKGIGTFVTGRQDQSSVAVNVVEGGDASGKHATPIGKCVVRQLPPGLPPKTPVEVRFAYAANGRLTVEAWLPTVERQASLTIERVSGMSETMLVAWEQRLKEGQLFEPPSAQAGAGEQTGEETSEEPTEGSPELEAWPESELDGVEMQVEPGGPEPAADLDAVPDLTAHDNEDVSEEPDDEIEGEPADEDVSRNDDEDLSDFLNQFR